MITIKSDDVAGRTQAYEAIVKNAPIKKPNIPESFHVLIKELQAIWLNLDLLDRQELLEREDEIMRRYEEIIRVKNSVWEKNEEESAKEKKKEKKKTTKKETTKKETKKVVAESDEAKTSEETEASEVSWEEKK